MSFRFQQLVCGLFLGLGLTPLAAQGQEWTRFRGPNGSGISDATFPAQWGASDFAWSITLPGSGHSSPVVWGKKVFVTCADPDTAQRTLLCLSNKDGATLWTKNYDSHTFHQHGDNSYASSTPAVDADHVYVCWNTPEEFSVAALTHDGAEVWKTDLGPFISQHGGGNSPIVVGDMLLVGDDQEGKQSFLFGLDRQTGKIRWQTPRKKAKFSAATPVVFHAPGGAAQAVFCSMAEGMTALDPETGRILWQEPKVFDSRTVGSPTVGDGLIFATCGDAGIGHTVTAVKPGHGAASIAWSTRSETPYVPTLLVKGGLLFLWNDRGVVTCVHAATGEKIWQEHVPGAYYSSPICAGNVLYNVTKKGEVIAIAAGEKFELLGQTPLNDKCHSTPAISGGLMFVRTFTHLYCVKGTGGQASR